MSGRWIFAKKFDSINFAIGFEERSLDAGCYVSCLVGVVSNRRSYQLVPPLREDGDKSDHD